MTRGSLVLVSLLSLGVPTAAYMSAVATRVAPRHTAPAMMAETPMERAQREREEDAAKRARIDALRTPKQETERSLFGMSAPQACETSFDCEQPLVCCDLLFTSVCCAGGQLIPRVDPAVQLQMIPIPVERDSPGPDVGPAPPRGF